MMKVNTLRPGLLVSVKTSIRGNVSYNRRDIVSGEEFAKWETERTTIDPVEHEAATKLVQKATWPIRRLCSKTVMQTLLCPESKAQDLDKAIVDARREVDEFNANAKVTRIDTSIFVGRIAPDDVEAVRAINTDLRNLLEDMQEGVANLDVRKIREAANRARAMGQMLSDDAQDRVKKAIQVARAAANQIKKAGEQAAQEVDLTAIRTIKEARTAFLDLEPVGEVAAPQADARTLDLTPTESVTAPKASAAAIELE